MLPSLDIRTLVFIANATGLCMAILFGLVALGEESRSNSLALWSGAFLSKGVGLLLIFLRGKIPDWASFPIANHLVVIDYQLLLAGVCIFVGRPPRWKLHGVFSLFALGILVATWLSGVYTVFLGSVAVLLGGLAVLLLMQLVRAPAEGMRWSQAFVAFLVGIEVLLLTVRFGWHLADATRTSFYIPAPVPVMFIIQVILGSLLLGPGLLAMVYRKAHVQQLLAIADLQAALAKVRTLQGLLPICAQCKKIRDDDGTWTAVERYVGRRTQAQFSHGICPECAKMLYPEYVDE